MKEGKVWSYNKYKIGFEGGEVPTARGKNIWFFWPVLMFVPYSMHYLYARMVGINFLKWYVAIKWKRQTDNNESDD